MAGKVLAQKFESVADSPYVMLKPLSTDTAALEATVATIEAMIPGSHKVSRLHGQVDLQDGEICVASTDPDFIVWAAPRQGYVVSARRLSGGDS